MIFPFIAKSQNISSLPVVPYTANNYAAQKPLVIYISGDGGENSFSKSLVKQIAAKGYPVVFFNSLKYFWSKKTPEQCAADVEKVIQYYRAQWKVQHVMIIGYSFGADVAPFIATRLSKEVFASLNNIVLISPSNATDFEVHVSLLFGKGKITGSSVPAEINKITQKPVLILQGEDESERVEKSALKNTNYKIVVLKGGHRYDSNTSELTDTIFKNL